jgi:hypothetical protein
MSNTTRIHFNAGWWAGEKGDERICKKISTGRHLIFEVTAYMETMLSEMTLEAKVARSPEIAATAWFRQLSLNRPVPGCQRKMDCPLGS